MSETEATFAPQDGAEVLKRIKPRPRTASAYFCLRPDLLDEHEKLEEQLEELQGQRRERPGRMTDKVSEDEVAIARRIQAIEEEIGATELRVTLKAMPKDEWQDLTEKHPPRKGNQIDQFSGYNVEKVENEAIRLCMIDPVFDDASWAEFVAVLNPSDWAELRNLVRAANKGVIEAPKSSRAAEVLSSLAAGSQQPAPSE